MAIEQILDHEGEALALLPQQFVGKENVEALLSVLVGDAQSVEDVGWALLTERDVDTAIGTQLDDIGSIVGEARNGRDDDAYRRFVRARISVNKSRGTVADILAVTIAVLNDDTLTLNLIRSSGIATSTLKIEDGAVLADIIAILMKYLRATVSAGVRLIVEHSAESPTIWLELDVDDFDDAGAVMIGAED